MTRAPAPHPGARLALVLVGDELLSGRTRDANGAWLAGRLSEVGVPLIRILTVGDGEAEIAEAIRRAAADVGFVVVGGGLGPTEDDRTRHGLARALGVPLREDPGAWEHVVDCLRRRGRVAGEAQRRQALVPEGAGILGNPEGTAPGLGADLAGVRVLVLPGVPREFRAMVERHLLPEVLARVGVRESVTRSVFVAGLPESEVGARLGDLWSAPDLAVGSYPHEGEVEVRIAARGPGSAARADAAAGLAMRRLGTAAVGEKPLAEAVLDLLRARRMTLALAESVTGGLLAAMLTEVPGASDVVVGAWVTYSDGWKTSCLGVPEALLATEGAVSEAVARAMAEGALARSGAAAALALTGSAGPTPAPGPSGPVAAGTVFLAVGLRGAPVGVARLDLPGLPRALVRRRAALAALDRLRHALLGSAG